jgi:pimeloyl-ACP methyl ester carboxylesterase
LIHGLAASLFDWGDLIPKLVERGYSANALDLLGHGNSFKPAHLDEYNITNVYAHFNEWIESLHFDEPLILIGHSLGGYLAIRYALIHADRVRGLVLADPFFSLEQLPFFLRINYHRPFLSSSMIERTPEWIFRKMIDLTSLSIRNGYVLPESVRIQTAADYKRAHPGIFNIVHSIQDPSPQLSSLTQPTFVVWGARDLTLAPSSFLNLLKEIPNSKGTAIAGAGHVPHQSNPAEFNQLVMDFLRTLD